MLTKVIICNTHVAETNISAHFECYFLDLK